MTHQLLYCTVYSIEYCIQENHVLHELTGTDWNKEIKRKKSDEQERVYGARTHKEEGEEGEEKVLARTRFICVT